MEPSLLIDEDDEMGEAPKNATKCYKTVEKAFLFDCWVALT